MPFAEPTPIPGQGGFQPNTPWWNYSVPIGELQGGWQGSNLMSPYDPSYAYGGYGNSSMAYQGYTPYTDFSSAYVGSQGNPTVQVFNDQSGANTGAIQMPQDTSQTPGDVFGGLQDPVGAFSEPGALNDPFGYGGVNAGGSSDFPTGSGVDASGSAEFPSSVPSSGPMSPYDPSFPYGAGAAPGMTGPGMYQAGTYIPGGSPGSLYGTNYGSMGYSLSGVPGTFVTTPSGQTYSTAIGMFGLGGMNAAGGAGFSLGSGPLWADVMVASRGGADRGFGDKGAVQDFLDYKTDYHLAKDPNWSPPMKLSPKGWVNAKATGLNWGGNKGGVHGLPSYAVTPWVTPTTPNWTPPPTTDKPGK